MKRQNLASEGTEKGVEEEVKLGKTEEIAQTNESKDVAVVPPRSKKHKDEDESNAKKVDKKVKLTQTITLTFGDQAEQHAGTQIIGTKAKQGFDLNDLKLAKAWFEGKGIACELVCLNNFLPEGKEEELGITADKAYILIARKGVNAICSADDLYVEQSSLQPDTRCWMRGRVVNKKARHNLCFADAAQQADYENKKGTIVAYETVPQLNKIRGMLPLIAGDKANNLVCESNIYYDVNKCFIGYHGDSERVKVIAVRLGLPMLLHYQWFHKFVPVSARSEFKLEHGDLYIMSHKSVGTDWKTSSILTLRHAAGRAELIEWKPKKTKAKKDDDE